jgi:uncharacterized membrane protein YhaH (DUF805 family)
VIFGDIFLAGIVGTSAYLQASAKGWWMVLAGAALLTLVFAAAFALGVSLTASGNQTASDAHSLKFFALGMLAFASLCLLIGAAFGVVTRRWISPGKVGGIAFVASYLVVNLVSLTLIFGR